MHDNNNERLLLLNAAEADRRLGRVRQAMLDNHISELLISDNANVYYLTGRVFRGFVFISLDIDSPIYFVRRPASLSGGNVYAIRKVEEIPAILSSLGLANPTRVALELDTTPYSAVCRVMAAFAMPELQPNGSPVMRAARSVKTPLECDEMRRSGAMQTPVYKNIPSLFREGMTDIELQIEIERELRLRGCLGQFRVSGPEMELFMGNVLTGDNADAPSPYDFAMGGAGLNPSLPVGADGSLVRPGMPVMVDVNGNFTGHMTDMTRTYSYGPISDATALKAHALSIDICHAVAEAARPGVAAADLYNMAADMVKTAQMEPYFMGHRQHAGFIGHGVGIEINEAPVIAPRSRDILAEGNAIALEPKFVIPGIGAVGIENTYLVTDEAAMECITLADEGITDLC